MEAWAAVEHGNGIVVDTISSSEQESRKKWLSVRGGYKVPDGMGDFAIREKFGRLALGVVEIKRVTTAVDGAGQTYTMDRQHPKSPTVFSLFCVGRNHITLHPFEDIGAAECEFNKAKRGETDDPVISGFLYSTKTGLLDHFYRAPE